jgi:hypothetical protein
MGLFRITNLTGSSICLEDIGVILQANGGSDSSFIIQSHTLDSSSDIKKMGSFLQIDPVYNAPSSPPYLPTFTPISVSHSDTVELERLRGIIRDLMDEIKRLNEKILFPSHKSALVSLDDQSVSQNKRKRRMLTMHHKMGVPVESVVESQEDLVQHSYSGYSAVSAETAEYKIKIRHIISEPHGSEDESLTANQESSQKPPPKSNQKTYPKKKSETSGE